MAKKKELGIQSKKEKDFSKWYTELINKAELADTRYNVKGFVCYMPWATRTIKKMYGKYEAELEKLGHEPLTMPSVIPERNFKLEAEHVEGFSPEVFWITHAGKKKLDERLALRPTSETALYQMYSLWIRSYKDLPFKRYLSCQVWRNEGTTRPFLRAREFHWIEAHNVFATMKDAMAQVHEDMRTTHKLLEEEFAIPIMFFQRPAWDTFPGAVHTYAADALTESGKVIQLPSTHLLGTNFSKPFNVTFTDKNGKKRLGFITCYGPAISRIYGAMIAILGDDQGLILPFDLSPVQIVIIPIPFKGKEQKIRKECENIKKLFENKYITKVDWNDDKTPGEKFNHWEMKGVPIRIEIGPKDLAKKQAAIVSRLDGKREFVKKTKLEEHVNNIAKNYTAKLKKRHARRFASLVKKTGALKDVKDALNAGRIACTGFCSINLDGMSCAETIEKMGGLVRGKKISGEKNKFKKCVVCGKPAKETVYIAKAY
ncbi:MAG: proline--tRNA ligase [Nanoarchaeota archaeon]|nr:proline--tRNA ligase [Nanoarchaeota archaeon]